MAYPRFFYSDAPLDVEKRDLTLAVLQSEKKSPTLTQDGNTQRFTFDDLHFEGVVGSGTFSVVFAVNLKDQSISTQHTSQKKQPTHHHSLQATNTVEMSQKTNLAAHLRRLAFSSSPLYRQLPPLTLPYALSNSDFSSLPSVTNIDRSHLNKSNLSMSSTAQNTSMKTSSLADWVSDPLHVPLAWQPPLNLPPIDSLSFRVIYTILLRKCMLNLCCFYYKLH